MTDSCAVPGCPFVPAVTLVVDELFHPETTAVRTLRMCRPHGGVLRFGLVGDVVTALGLAVTEASAG